MPTRILFVCLGNICRSPAAEGVVRSLAPHLVTDSAGTGGWHVGEAPYAPMQTAARARGYDISDLRARQFSPMDFVRFDLILAMDSENLREIEALRPAEATAPVRSETIRARVRCVSWYPQGTPCHPVSSTPAHVMTLAASTGSATPRIPTPAAESAVVSESAASRPRPSRTARSREAGRVISKNGGRRERRRRPTRGVATPFAITRSASREIRWSRTMTVKLPSPTRNGPVISPSRYFRVILIV